MDCLKPHKPPIYELATLLSHVDGVTGVNIVLDEVDAETHTLRIIIDGKDLHYHEVEEALKQAGAVVHSIDQVIAGKPMPYQSQKES